jgi:alkylation response protein AidB-like acyl-CoA dehydrogenase
MRQVNDSNLLDLLRRAAERLGESPDANDRVAAIHQYGLAHLHHDPGWDGLGLTLAATRQFIEAFALRAAFSDVIDHTVGIDWLTVARQTSLRSRPAMQRLEKERDRFAIALARANAGWLVVTTCADTPFDQRLVFVPQRRRCRCYLHTLGKGDRPHEFTLYGERWARYRLRPTGPVCSLTIDSPLAKIAFHRLVAYQLAGAHALGRRAFDMTVTRTTKREQFNRRLIDNQHVRFALAAAWSRLLSFSEFVDAVLRNEADATAGSLDRAADTLSEVFRPCLQFHGAHGLTSAGGIEQLHRAQALLQLKMTTTMTALRRMEHTDDVV